MLKSLIQNRKVYKLTHVAKCVRCAYSTSISPKIETENEEFNKQLKEYEKISQMSSKPRIKKPQKEPFTKNLFLGQFDTDILTFPQIDLDDLKKLESNIETVKAVVEENNTDILSKHLLKVLSEHQLLGLESSQVLGGRELTLTDTLRFHEHLSNHKLKYNLLENEQFGINTLNKFGNEQQIKLYLEKLIKGELLSTFCVVENKSNEQKLNTKATYDELKKSWVINGEKNWILNGKSADLFIVVAETGTTITYGMNESKLSVFIVDRNTPGINVSTYEATDSKELEYSDVIFTDCVVPEENVLGEVGNGSKMLQTLSVGFHLSCAPASITTSKKILNNFAELCLNSPSALNIHETEVVSAFVGQLVTSIYAMESMTYLTAGLLDQYENQDCDIEAAITKVFSTEQSCDATIMCRNILGPSTLLESHWCNKLHKDAVNQSIYHETNDNLKIVIGLTGLQYAGIKLNETVKMLRNPFFYSAFALKRMLTIRRQVNDNPKLNLYLNNYVHPSLYTTSQQLEYCVIRLQYVTESMLAREGADIINKHLDLQRLANAVIDIYAMVATIGRASRSYCIGLPHASFEMLIASTFCFNALERVKMNFTKILSGPYETSDESFRKISGQLFKSKEYFPVHPLTRNF